MEHLDNVYETSGHLNDLGVSLYVDALKLKRTQNLPVEMLRHVEECQQCRREITGLFEQLLEEDYGHITDHPTLGPIGRRAQSNWRFTYKLAAVIVALLSVAVTAYYLITSRPEQQHVAERTTTVPADTTKEAQKVQEQSKEETAAFAANFVEDPEMEDLLRDQTRSAAVTGILPRNGATVTVPVHFQWNAAERGPFQITLLDNRGNTLTARSVAGSSYVVRMKIPAGLYYWKLEDRRDLLHVGKFRIEK